MMFDEFIADRGTPKFVFSDHGSQLSGAKRIMEQSTLSDPQDWNCSLKEVSENHARRDIFFGRDTIGFLSVLAIVTNKNMEAGTFFEVHSPVNAFKRMSRINLRCFGISEEE